MRTGAALPRAERRRRPARTGARAGSRPHRSLSLWGLGLVEADVVDPVVDPAAVPGEANDRHRGQIETGRALGPALLRHRVERNGIELPLVREVHHARPVVTALFGGLRGPLARGGIEAPVAEDAVAHRVGRAGLAVELAV